MASFHACINMPRMHIYAAELMRVHQADSIHQCISFEIRRLPIRIVTPAISAVLSAIDHGVRLGTMLIHACMVPSRTYTCMYTS